MQIIIFGGYGFIGSYLTNFFSKKNYNVDIVVRKKSIKKNINLNFRNLFFFEKSTINRQYKIGIICSSKNETKISSKTKNDKDIEKILNQISTCKVKKLIYVSTYHCNRRPRDNKTKDYVYYHKTNEKKVINFCKKNNIKFYILRTTNLFGFTANKFIQRDTLVPYCFINEAKNHEKITLRSNGRQYRDFLSLDNFSNNVVKVLNNSRFENKIISIISNNPLKIFQIAHKVASYYRKKILVNIKISINKKDKRKYSKKRYYPMLTNNELLINKNGESLFFFINRYIKKIELYK